MRCVGIKVLLWVVCVCCSAPLIVGGVEQDDVADELSDELLPDLTVAENRWFSVVGADPLAVRAVERLSAELAPVVRGWIPFPSAAAPLIVVQLVEPDVFDEMVEDGSEYRVVVDASGSITVSVRWSEQVALDDVCLALAEAWLLQVVGTVAADSQRGSVPDWLVYGVGAQLEVAWITGRRASMVETAARYGPLDWQAIFTGYSDEWSKQRYAAECYWVIQVLREAIRPTHRRIWVHFLVSDSVDWERVEHAVGIPLDERLRNLWWVVARNEMLRTRAGPVLSIDASRDRCIRLAYMVVEDDGGDVRVAAGSVTQDMMEQNVWLEEELVQRLGKVKLHLTRVNPIYYNAMLSLGQVYEALIAGDYDAAKGYYAAFEGDYDMAGRLANAAVQLLLDADR